MQPPLLIQPPVYVLGLYANNGTIYPLYIEIVNHTGARQV